VQTGGGATGADVATGPPSKQEIAAASAGEDEDEFAVELMRKKGKGLFVSKLRGLIVTEIMMNNEHLSLNRRR
jgi:hypothetical protein